MTSTANLARLLEAFFTDRLVRQRQASRHTIAAYRDTFRLLLRFVQQRHKKEPSMLQLEDLDTPLIGAFLDHLEKERGNTARSRNARLAAIHSFFRYAALHEPDHSAVIQRVLAMPSKRYDRKLVGFLTRVEIDALLAAPDRSRWGGRRDYIIILVAVQTGLRVSELIGLGCISRARDRLRGFPKPKVVGSVPPGGAKDSETMGVSGGWIWCELHRILHQILHQIVRAPCWRKRA